MPYHTSEPLLTILNEVEELKCLARAGEDPYSDKLKVQIGL